MLKEEVRGQQEQRSSFEDNDLQLSEAQEARTEACSSRGQPCSYLHSDSMKLILDLDSQHQKGVGVC